MARVISEGPGSQTIQTDDGQIVVIPTGISNIGGAPPPPPGALPQGVLDFLSPPGDIPSFTPGELQPPPPTSGPFPGRVAAAGGASPGPAPFDTGPLPSRVAAAVGRAPSPEPAPAAPALLRLPSVAQTAEAGAEGLGLQEQAALDVNKVEQQQLAATGEAIKTGAQRRVAVADAAERARQADLLELEKRTLDLDKEITENASKSVDPQRRWKSLGTMNQVAIGIAAALAGMGNALAGQGGPNPVMEQLRQTMEDDIRAQMADREDRAQRIGMRGQQIDRYRNLAGDRVAGFNARMAEEMERQARDLESLAATYGSEKAKANALNIAGQFRQRKAEYVAGAAQTQWDRDLAAAKQAEDVRHSRAAERLQGWSIAENKRQADQDLKYKYDALKIDAAKLDAAGRADEAKALRAAGEQAYKLEIPNTKTKSGSPVMGRSEKEAQDLRSTQAGVESGARAIDEIVNVLRTVGPQTDLAESPEWQRLKSNEGAIVSAINQAMLGGVVREGDIQFIRKTFEGGNLSGVEAMIRAGLGTTAEHGLLNTRGVLEHGFSDRLRSQDKDAEPYTVPPLYGLTPTPESESGKSRAAVVAEKTPAEIAAGGKRTAAGELLANSPGGVVARVASKALFGSSKGPEEAARAAEEQSGFTLPTVTESQEKELLQLGQRAAHGDTDARSALASVGASGRPGLAQGALFAAAENGDVVLVDEMIKALPPEIAKQEAIGARARSVAIGAQVGNIAAQASGGDVEAQKALMSMTQSADKDIKAAATRELANIAARRRGK